MKNLFGKQYEKLTAAYKMTIYRCLNPPMVLKIGEVNSVIDHFLMNKGYEEMCILTTCNPKSVVQSNTENQQSQDELVLKIEEMGFSWLQGVNQDPDMKFPDEQSCWILGMGRKDADQLAKHWDQNAYVFYRMGKSAELRWVNI